MISQIGGDQVNTEKPDNYTEDKKFDLPDLGNQKPERGGDRRSIDYHLSLDMAKDLAMVERTEKGKQARRYFIESEKKLHAISSGLPALSPPINPLLLFLRHNLVRTDPKAFSIDPGLLRDKLRRHLHNIGANYLQLSKKQWIKALEQAGFEFVTKLSSRKHVCAMPIETLELVNIYPPHWSHDEPQFPNRPRLK